MIAREFGDVPRALNVLNAGADAGFSGCENWRIYSNVSYIPELSGHARCIGALASLSAARPVRPAGTGGAPTERFVLLEVEDSVYLNKARRSASISVEPTQRRRRTAAMAVACHIQRRLLRSVCCVRRPSRQLFKAIQAALGWSARPRVLWCDEPRAHAEDLMKFHHVADEFPLCS